MRLICYGCGPQFRLEKFQTIKNFDNKPRGGLWSSPIDTRWGWRDWCIANEFGNLETSFLFDLCPSAKICVVDSFGDFLDVVRWVDEWKIDWEHTARQFDAVHLTIRGEDETRYTRPGLYGWDCETVLIFNPDKIMGVTRDNGNPIPPLITRQTCKAR